jgi:hypothetical protein
MLVAFETSHKMDQEESTSSRKCIAISCVEHKNMNAKMQVETSSSSSSEEDADDDEDKDEAYTSSSNVGKETIQQI